MFLNRWRVRRYQPLPTHSRRAVHSLRLTIMIIFHSINHQAIKVFHRPKNRDPGAIPNSLTVLLCLFTMSPTQIRPKVFSMGPRQNWMSGLWSHTAWKPETASQQKLGSRLPNFKSYERAGSCKLEPWLAFSCEPSRYHKSQVPPPALELNSEGYSTGTTFGEIIEKVIQPWQRVKK